MGYELVCCIELKDTQVYNYLLPVAMHPDVDKVWIIRSRESAYGEIPKSQYIVIRNRIRIIRWLRMLWACLKLARRKEVRGFLSFNPFPYGVISFLPSRLFRKPIHFGLIGADWNRHAIGPFSWLLLPILRSGAFLTAYGEHVRSEMVARGIQARRIAVLPHSVDLDRFPVCRGTCNTYSAIFTGSLIHRKRVDVILRSFALVLGKHPNARLCIVGDGPLRATLEALAHRLNIADSVDFVGAVPDVQHYLARSRILVMASSSEGFPFSIVEGICSGLVPVTTPVNAISHFLRHGSTAFFFPEENAEALASYLALLLDDASLYQEMQENVLDLRSSFSFDAALKVWRLWLDGKDCKLT